MSVLDIICLTFGVLGVAFGARCYLELHRWATLIQGARIAIARKGRVKLQAPLQEWALWARMLDGDDAANGRVIYQDAGTRVALLKPPTGEAWQIRSMRVAARVYGPLRRVAARIPRRGKAAAA